MGVDTESDLSFRFWGVQSPAAVAAEGGGEEGVRLAMAGMAEGLWKSCD